MEDLLRLRARIGTILGRSLLDPIAVVFAYIAQAAWLLGRQAARVSPLA